LEEVTARIKVLILAFTMLADEGAWHPPGFFFFQFESVRFDNRNKNHKVPGSDTLCARLIGLFSDRTRLMIQARSI